MLLLLLLLLRATTCRCSHAIVTARHLVNAQRMLLRWLLVLWWLLLLLLLPLLPLPLVVLLLCSWWLPRLLRLHWVARLLGVLLATRREARVRSERGARELLRAAPRLRIESIEGGKHVAHLRVRSLLLGLGELARRLLIAREHIGPRAHL